MKKTLPTDAISKELTQSVFFQKPADEQTLDQQQKASPSNGPHSPPPVPQADMQKVNEASNQDVMTDVITSQIQDINPKQWQEIIENTETQNSALRLTKEERYAVEDMVNDLRRKYGIKTSMNEVARLGLLLLIADFKQRKKASLIHQVKKA